MLDVSEFEIDRSPMQHTVILDSGNKGPTVGVSSGVHGNEPFGVKVTQDFLGRVLKGTLPLLRGKVVLILQGNEEALKLNERFSIDDLNRVVNGVPQDEVKNNYEQQRGREIKTLIDQTEPEYWLDLHSFSAPEGLPYAFSSLHGYQKLGGQLGIQNMAINMANANKKTDGGKLLRRGVSDYVNDNGGNAFTFEAGNHTNPQCYIDTYQALINFLLTQGMIDGKEVKVHNDSTWLMPDNDIVQIGGEESSHVHIEDKHIFKGNFEYAGGHPQSFKKYIKGEVIGYDIVDEEITGVVNAPYDGYIIMPKDPKICIKGKEVFYFGKNMSEIEI